MPISFRRKSSLTDKKVEITTAAGRTTPLLPTSYFAAQVQSSLIDLRNPDAFRRGFMPGSYNVPDLACVAAARRTGLFRSRKIYLLAENEDQLQLCSENGDLGDGSEVVGWFSPDAIEEWQRQHSEIGSIEAISSDTLFIRMAAWNTLLFDIYQREDGWQPSHPAAMGFCMDDLPLSLDGLPVESSICLTAPTSSLACFAASLLWNFGFHKISYLCSGRRISFPLAS